MVHPTELSRRRMIRITTNEREVLPDATEKINSPMAGYCCLCCLDLRFGDAAIRSAGTNHAGDPGREDREDQKVQKSRFRGCDIACNGCGEKIESQEVQDCHPAY